MKKIRMFCMQALLVVVVCVICVAPKAGAMSQASSGVLSYVEVEFDSPGLDGVTSVAVSPDGKHVYTSSNVDDAVSVFSRDSESGRLTFVQRITNGDQGGLVAGLTGAAGVIVSPDGKSVYVTGSDDNAVVFFQRSATTGKLLFEDVYKDGINTEWLADPRGIAISPDGEDVYVASCGDDAVQIFSRSSTTGALSHAGAREEGVDKVFGLLCAFGIAATNDNVYVTGLNSDAVVVFDRDSFGDLTYLERERDGLDGVDGLDAPRSLAVKGNKLYVASSVDDAVAVFERGTVDGSLTYKTCIKDGSSTPGLDGAWAVATSGLHVYAGSSVDNAIVILQYLTWPGAILFHKGVMQNGVDGVGGLGFVVSIAVSPDDRHVYAGSVGSDTIAVFERDTTTGMLSFVHFQGNVDGLAGDGTGDISPDGKHVYIASDVDNAVAIFSRELINGALNYEEAVRDNFGDIDGLGGASDVVVSPDGKHVYVTGRKDDAVAAFTRNSTSGELSFVEREREGIGGVDSLDGAHAVAVDPDGAYVYVVSDGDDSLTTFSRNSSSGELTLYAVLRDGDYGSIDGLDGANAVAVSPDGEHVYVTSQNDHAVAVFDWKYISPFWVLTFVEQEKDGVSQVDGLRGANGIAVSPDGKHVYVTGGEDNAVAVFSRNSVSGALSFVGVKKDGSSGVDGLAGAHGVSVSPCGLYVFVTGAGDGAVAVFVRNPSTGALSYKGMEQDGVDGVEGLAGANAVIVSPDGINVYARSSGDNAVVVFVFRRYAVYLPLVLTD